MQQSEKRTKIILWAVVAAAVIGCALWLGLPHGGTTDCTAEIWIDGQMVRGIYLPQAPDARLGPLRGLAAKIGPGTVRLL